MLKQTNFKDDEIIMNATSRGGKSLYSAEDASTLKVFPYLHEAGGLGNFSSTNLRKALAGKKANAGLNIGAYSETVYGNCAVKDLETMLQLVYLTFTDIRKDEEVYNVNKEQYMSMYANNASNPQFIYSDSLRSTMYAHDPMMSMVKAEDFAKADYDRMLAIAKERTANAADFTFNFVGSFDPEVLRPLVEKYIATLPACMCRETIKPVEHFAKGEHLNHFTIPMENPAASVYVIYSGTSKYNMRKGIMMDIFSQIMDIVYTETIREQEGGTYGVGTSADINNLNNEWMFLFGFDTNVEKQEYLKNRAKEELMKVVVNGVREEDFNKVKEYMLKQYDNNQRENSYWSGVLTNRVFNNNTATGYKQALESISTTELNYFLRSLFLDNENLVEVVMCGETK